MLRIVKLLSLGKYFVKTASVVDFSTKYVDFTEFFQRNDSKSKFSKFPHCEKVVCQNPKKSKTICCEYQKRDRHAEN